MQLFVLKIGLFLGGALWYSSIYTIHITTINGQDKSMEDFRGKKILVVVLPVTRTATDSAFLKTIDSVSRNYSQKLSVIGVLSFEDGFQTSDLNSLQIYYHSLLGNQVILTQGMYTRKESGKKQHELFFWLTHSGENTHFDIDVSGIGQKFFVNEQGELYGVAAPEGKLSNNVMQRMIQ
jgi:glutathione peroxidase